MIQAAYAHRAREDAMPEATAPNRTLLYKWIANLIIPIAAYLLLVQYSSLTPPMVAFLAVTLWAVCAWAMETLNDIAVGILLPGLYILFCEGVNIGVVYAPWRSEIWIISVGGFILGKIIQETGLGKRIAMGSVRAMGGSFSGALLGLTIGAILLSPLVPSIMGKAAILCGVAISLCDAMNFKPKGREATAIMLGACIAVGSTKLAWLTGAGDLVMGMGLVDKAMNIQTSWMEYAKYNFVPAMLYTFLSMSIVLVLLRSSVSRETISATVQQTYNELGPMSAEQKRAMFLLLVTVVLLSTDKLHGISAGVVLMIITALAFAPGMALMDAGRLSRVNFAPIFFIMGCMAIGSTGGFLKVTQWMAGLVLPLFSDTGVMLASLCSYATGVGVNFLLTPLAATSTLTAPITELGMRMGLDPRILYFSFQYGLDNLIFPYEYALYLYFFSSGYINFREMALVMAVRMLLAGLFVACIAMPYWRLVL